MGHSIEHKEAETGFPQARCEAQAGKHVARFFGSSNRRTLRMVSNEDVLTAKSEVLGDLRVMFGSRDVLKIDHADVLMKTVRD